MPTTSSKDRTLFVPSATGAQSRVGGSCGREERSRPHTLPVLLLGCRLDDNGAPRPRVLAARGGGCRPRGSRCGGLRGRRIRRGGRRRGRRRGRGLGRGGRGGRRRRGGRRGGRHRGGGHGGGGRRRG